MKFSHPFILVSILAIASAADTTNRCVDDPNYVSSLGLSCEHHSQVDCHAFAHVGMPPKKVDELLKHCPSSCRVDGCSGDKRTGSIRGGNSVSLPMLARSLEQRTNIADSADVFPRSLQDDTCFDGKCKDDPDFRSKFFLPCESHISFDCGVLQAVGFSAREVTDLVRSCPCSCKQECAGPSAVDTDSTVVETSPPVSSPPTKSPTKAPTTPRRTAPPSPSPTKSPTKSPTTASPTARPSQAPVAAGLETEDTIVETIKVEEQEETIQPQHPGEVLDKPQHPGEVFDKPQHPGEVWDKPQTAVGEVLDKPQHPGEVIDKPQSAGEGQDKTQHPGEVFEEEAIQSYDPIGEQTHFELPEVAPEDILHNEGGKPLAGAETLQNEKETSGSGAVPPAQIAAAETYQDASEDAESSWSTWFQENALYVACAAAGIVGIVATARFVKYRARKRMEKEIVSQLAFEYKYGSDAKGEQPNDLGGGFCLSPTTSMDEEYGEEDRQHQQQA